MEKIELSVGIIQYKFDPVEDVLYGNNVIAILSGDKAILIDTGYDFQTEEVRKDLIESGISIEEVIVSNFQKEHVQGMKLLGGITIYGSQYYQPALNQWASAEEQNYYEPTIKIDKSRKIIFGDQVLELIHNPGQSICTLLIKINEKYLYIADELMYATTGEPLLPRVTKHSIINYYVSVHNLAKLSNYIFLPGHGDVIFEQHKIIADTKNVCYYLCEILSHDEEITVEQATKNCKCTFLHTGWHENVYK
ncbi:MAG: hypothetical protein H6Q59_1391 [Firmicutes bacterium]|nr:hypothetical protein [Bacillota bacterium]